MNFSFSMFFWIRIGSATELQSNGSGSPFSEESRRLIQRRWQMIVYGCNIHLPMDTLWERMWKIWSSSHSRPLY